MSNADKPLQTEPTTAVVALPHGLSATYTLRPPPPPPPYVMTAAEHAEAVRQAALRELESRAPEDCPF